MELAFAPFVEIRTYVETPAANAACARAKLRSRSMARWAGREPAAERVVPRELMKMEGGGEAGKWVGQVEGSVEGMGWSLGEEVGLGGGRRA